jgi:hypothetical protein
VPAKNGAEVSCTAGVTSDGKWIRLFPIPYRFLDEDKQFRKYQWIEVDTLRAKGDPRPESYKLNADTIVICEAVPSTSGWRDRWSLVRPLLATSLCELQEQRDLHGHPTLGLFKPARIYRLIIEPVKSPNWTEKQLAYLQQEMLFHESPATKLEKVPYDFKYEFQCAHPSCRGHSMICTDWEMSQSYRRWRREYGAEWEKAFRNRYEREMIDKFDTHFYVGTIHQHPGALIVIGLFYPPHVKQADLFS